MLGSHRCFGWLEARLGAVGDGKHRCRRLGPSERHGKGTEDGVLIGYTTDFVDSICKNTVA